MRQVPSATDPGCATHTSSYSPAPHFALFKHAPPHTIVDSLSRPSFNCTPVSRRNHLLQSHRGDLPSSNFHLSSAEYFQQSPTLAWLLTRTRTRYNRPVHNLHSDPRQSILFNTNPSDSEAPLDTGIVISRIEFNARTYYFYNFHRVLFTVLLIVSRCWTSDDWKRAIFGRSSILDLSSPIANQYAGI